MKTSQTMKEKYKELTKLHGQVKNHPFRLNRKRPKQYYALMRVFLDEFWQQTKKTYSDADKRMDGIGYFLHELSSNTWHITHVEEDSEHKKECTISIEKGIGAIHKFINTSKFDFFQTYYLGCNYNKKEGRKSAYVWNGKDYEKVKPKCKEGKTNKCVTWKMGYCMDCKDNPQIKK